MGTRSLTMVYDKDTNERICVMYRQMDGYPTGHGQDLKDWAQHIHLVNGIGMTETRQIANGMGCLAAQMVAHFKHGAGGIYLYPPSIVDAGQNYEYHLRCQEQQVYLLVKSYTTVLYDGPIKDFDANKAESVNEEA